MPFRWRPDGDYVADVPPARRIMPVLMRGRNASSVYFEQKVDVGKTLAFLNDVRTGTGLHVTLLHLVLWAAARTIQQRPRLNRFTAGGRIYQRRGIWISFSAKKAKTDDAPLVVVKRQIDPAWSLEDLIRKIEAGIEEGRGDAPTATDKELSILLRMPVMLLGGMVRLVEWLDRFGLLPSAFIRNDPFFASLFVANLGSIRMEAPYHHLYEYGNVPIFLMIGHVKDEIVVGDDGRPAVRPLMTLRYTFDERIEDGLYCARALDILRQILENPASAVSTVTPPTPRAS